MNLARVFLLAPFLTLPLTLALAAQAQTPPAAVASSAAIRVDSSASVIARSYSPGLIVTPTVGYSYLLWGDPASGLFGYVRPSASASMTTSSYSGRGELELYPVSFLGFSGGRTLLHRFANATGQDCSLGQCMGDLFSSDLSVRALFRYQSIFGTVKYTRLYFDAAADRSQALLDPASALLLSPDGEIATMTSAVVGGTIDETWSAGGIYQGATLQNRSGTQNAEYLFARYSMGDYRFMGAAGRFESELKNPGLSLVASVTWVGTPTLLP